MLKMRVESWDSSGSLVTTGLEILTRQQRAKPLILLDSTTLRHTQNTQDHCQALTHTRVLLPDMRNRLTHRHTCTSRARRTLAPHHDLRWPNARRGSCADGDVNIRSRRDHAQSRRTRRQRSCDARSSTRLSHVSAHACARLLGLPESRRCHAARRAHEDDRCAHGRAHTRVWHAHATRKRSVPPLQRPPPRHVHVAKVDLTSKGASTRPVSMSTATLLVTEATASKSAGESRQALGT